MFGAQAPGRPCAPRGVRDVRGTGASAGTQPDHVRRVRRRRPGAPGPPVDPRPDGHRRAVPPLRRARPGHRRPCPDCRGEGRAHRGAHLHRRHPGRRRHRLHAAPRRPGAVGPRGGPPATSTCTCGCGPTTASSATGYDLVHELPRHRSPRRRSGADLDVRDPRRRRGPRRPAGHPARPGVPPAGPRACPTSRAGAGATCIVQVVVDTPTDLTPEQEELLRQLPSSRARRSRRPTTGCSLAHQVGLQVATVAATDGRPRGPHAFVDDLDAPVLGRRDRHHLERVLRLRPGERRSPWPTARGGWRPARFGRRVEPAGPIEHAAPTPTPPITRRLRPGEGRASPSWSCRS